MAENHPDVSISLKGANYCPNDCSNLWPLDTNSCSSNARNEKSLLSLVDVVVVDLFTCMAL